MLTIYRTVNVRYSMFYSVEIKLLLICYCCWTNYVALFLEKPSLASLSYNFLFRIGRRALILIYLQIPNVGKFTGLALINDLDTR